ncbi:transaldolase family protein [Poriferisphaera sp. WC338]|uniref:transaldolase family protein n=1 Tax=Poriferisphaera sp. WC338 TaxID=3425129 RepID=UPI003D816278
MSSPLRSLVDCGTKLWLDSIDPDLVKLNLHLGATGATSNPIIISGLINTGRFDDKMQDLFAQGHDDASVAWLMTDHMVKEAQCAFYPVWEKTRGNDGYVSFELDPLLEDIELGPNHEERVKQYITLGKKWAEGHENRMIKVPATPAGLDALEELAAAGITLNVTLIFSERQYEIARENVWRGRQRYGKLESFKSVYSIFVSRVDVYTEQHLPELIDDAQGQVGIVNAKRLWQSNQQWWKDKGVTHDQEIIFASTGTKKPEDPADKYVEALAGSDIQTNPPATNAAVEKLGKTYTRKVDHMPSAEVLADIDAKVDVKLMEDTLMEEGTAKFADPFKKLLASIADKRKKLAA